MVQKSSMTQAPLLIIAGPTGVGKTALAMELYDSLNSELISADSMQIYKNCNIGTAKLDKDLLKKYPHHNIDILDINEEFNVALFKEMTINEINHILKKGALPIIVGGTGLYIESLLFPYKFANCSKNEKIRENLQNILNIEGPTKLYEMLLEKDMQTAKNIDRNNTKRVIRALEIWEQTHIPMSLQTSQDNFEKSPFDYLIVVLTKDRQSLYKKIDERVDLMLEEGLINEAKFVYESQKKSNKPLQVASAIGYKEFFDYFEDKISLNEAIEKVKQHSRNYAKRQITWYKRYTKNILWLANDTEDDFNQNKKLLLNKYNQFQK